MIAVGITDPCGKPADWAAYVRWVQEGIPGVSVRRLASTGSPSDEIRGMQVFNVARGGTLIQWHPERLIGDPFSRKIIRGFGAAVRCRSAAHNTVNSLSANHQPFYQKESL